MWTRRLVLPLIALPVVLVAASLGSLYLLFERHQIEEEVLSRTRHLATAVEKELELQISALRILADTLSVDDEVEAKAALGKAWAGFSSRYPHWRNVRLFDRQGRPVADYPEYAQSLSMAGGESFRAAVETKQIQLGRIEPGPMGRLAFPIRVPVIRNGEATHVLSAAIDPAIFAGSLELVNLPSNWTAVVVDSHTAIVTRQPPPLQIGKAPSEGAINARRDNDHEGLYQGRSLEGIPIVGGVKWLNNFRWSVHTGYPRSSLLQRIGEYASLVALTSVCLVIIYVVLLLLYIRQNIRTRALDEDRQKLLTNEVLHRTKNLFSIIQALIMRSLKGTKPLEEEKAALISRLDTLSRTDSHLLSVHYERIRVDVVTRETISLFTDHYTLTAEEIWVSGSLAQNFCLLVHELTTNSLKYGALSVAAGSVVIEIKKINENVLFFSWEDKNGPPIIAMPTRLGFGLNLISMLSKGMGATSDWEFPVTGMKCSVTIPFK